MTDAGAAPSRLGELWEQLRAVAEGTERVVVLAQEVVDEKERIDELPNDLVLRRDLEDAAVITLRDQRVAVGQALGAGDERAEEVGDRAVRVLPDDFLRCDIDVDDAGRWEGAPELVRAVIEDRDGVLVEGDGVGAAGRAPAAPAPKRYRRWRGR